MLPIARIRSLRATRDKARTKHGRWDRFTERKKSTLSASLEWVSQVAVEFEESEFEIQTSELGERHVVIGGRPRCFL